MPITELDQVTEARLTWPEHKPRTSSRARSPFRNTSIDGEIRQIGWEMGRWGALDFILSRTSLRMHAADPGVALWWVTKKARHDLRVLACDKYPTQGENAHAIRLTLVAMRALERWGAYSADEAAEGTRLRLAPPEGMSGDVPWRTVLGALPPGIDAQTALDVLKSRYYRQAAAANSDEGALRRLNLAWEAAQRELKTPE